MKKSNILTAFMLSLFLAFSIMADGETEHGNYTDPPVCNPTIQFCGDSSTNSINIIIETITNLLTGH